MQHQTLLQANTATSASAPTRATGDIARNVGDRRYASMTSKGARARSAWGRASAPTVARRARARSAADRRYASMTTAGASARSAAGASASQGSRPCLSASFLTPRNIKTGTLRCWRARVGKLAALVVLGVGGHESPTCQKQALTKLWHLMARATSALNAVEVPCALSDEFAAAIRHARESPRAPVMGWWPLLTWFRVAPPAGGAGAQTRGLPDSQSCL